MFVVIWEYELRPDAQTAFEMLYGPGGAWAGLFAEYAGYIDTQLLRDERPLRYLTVDRWTSAADHDRFLAAARPRYVQIDALGDALTLAERCMGRYVTPC